MERYDCLLYTGGVIQAMKFATVNFAAAPLFALQGGENNSFESCLQINSRPSGRRKIIYKSCL
jgi:hypothetical protein